MMIMTFTISVAATFVHIFVEDFRKLAKQNEDKKRVISEGGDSYSDK